MREVSAYGVHFSQLIWYTKASCSSHDLIDVGVPLTRKLLNHWSLVVELYSRHNDLGNRYCISVSQITTDVFPLLESQIVSYIISRELSHQLVCKTNRAGITYASGASVFTPVYLWDTVIFSYLCSVLYIILCYFLLFHLYIILPVIRCKVLIAPL
jgi:hypothetical protein